MWVGKRMRAYLRMCGSHCHRTLLQRIPRKRTHAHMLAQGANSLQGRKAVVFLSSCDGVELHYELLVKVGRLEGLHGRVA